MKPNDLISIIMPAYNAQDFLCEAIESVQAQTYSNWELIIINDGSSDQTQKIATDYAQQDARITVIEQHNQGVSQSRNNGLKAAKGSYISFLDSDDYYQPTFLEKLHERSIETQSDICYCGALHEVDQQVQGSPYPEGNILISYAKGLVTYIEFYTMLIKADFLTQHNIGFNTSCSIGEDQEFVMHCAIYAKSSAVAEVLYFHRWNKASLISTMTPAKVHMDWESRKRSTQLVQKLYHGPEKATIIHFLKNWEDRIVMIYTKRLIQRIKQGDTQAVYKEIIDFGKIPYCWRRWSINHIKRAFILNTHQISLWKRFW